MAPGNKFDNSETSPSKEELTAAVVAYTFQKLHERRCSVSKSRRMYQTEQGMGDLQPGTRGDGL